MNELMLREQENFILTVVHIATFEANEFCDRFNVICDKSVIAQRKESHDSNTSIYYNRKHKNSV